MNIMYIVHHYGQGARQYGYSSRSFIDWFWNKLGILPTTVDLSRFKKVCDMYDDFEFWNYVHGIALEYHPDINGL